MKKLIVFNIFLFLCTISYSQTSFRFAWLSDIHIGYPTSEEDLKISVNDINSMDNIEFTIITGDITAIGSFRELSTAKNILDELKKPYFIIPGNHDCKWSESGSTDFIKLWVNDRFVFTYDKYLIIGLHQGPRMRMADGFWAPEDLRWLDSLLSSLTDKNQPIIFATHYPLDESIANWYEVVNRLNHYNVQVVLFGHGHRNKVYNFQSIQGIMGRSNLRGDKEIGGYTIAEVKNDSMFFYERIPDQEPTLWHQFESENKNIDYTISDKIKPDYSINTQYPKIEALWSFNTGYTIGSSAAIFLTDVIVGDASGKIFSISTTDGSLNWTFQTMGPIYSTPAVSNDRIVFGSSDSSIYCLRAEDGTLLWKYKTNAAVLGCPVMDDSLVFIGGSDNIFRALNLYSGKEIWRFEGLNGFVETKPAIYDDKLMFGAWDEYFYCLDKNSGDLVWKWRGDKRGVLYSPAVCWPVTNNESVFFAAPDRTLNAIDINTGNILWRTAKYEVRETLGISGNGEMIFIRTMNDSIIALPANREISDPVWITNAGFGYDISSAQIIEKDGIIFYPTKTGELYALNSKTGKILWIHKLSSGYINTVTALASDKIISTGFDGVIKLLYIKE